MRSLNRVTLGFLLAATATRLWSQAAPPANAPVAPAEPPDTGHVELRLAVFTMPTNRLVASSATAYSSASPAMFGAEFIVRSTQGTGIFLRYSSANATSSQRAGDAFTDLDGRILIGTRTFTFEAGYLYRTETVASVKSPRGFAQAGFRSDLRLGASGVMLGIAGAYLRQIAEEKDGSLGSGISGEASALYASNIVPAYVQLGFRRQTLQFKNSKTPPDRPEESSTVFIGIGYYLGLLR